MTMLQNIQNPFFDMCTAQTVLCRTFETLLDVLTAFILQVSTRKMCIIIFHEYDYETNVMSL